MRPPEVPFIGAKDHGTVCLMGIPLDRTPSYRPGTSLAPRAIREVSELLETYSPYLELDLNDVPFEDLGDLSPLIGSLEGSLLWIQETAEELIEKGKKLLAMGGEHLITLPLVRAYLKRWPDMVVVHLDAHMDLRNEYEGHHLSHATVMRRVWEVVEGRVYQLGIRSGTKEEWRFSQRQCWLCPYDLSRMGECLYKIGNAPVYLTIDLDVLDPAYLPGTGTPEGGGITPGDLFSSLPLFLERNLVGVDVVELSPAYDPSGASAILAAKVVRETLLLLGSGLYL